MRDLAPKRWRGWLLLQAAAGIGLAVGGARYYFTHPRRVTAAAPVDLVKASRDVFRQAADSTRLHAIWLGGHGERTIVHHHGYNSCAGVVRASRPEALTAWPLVREGLARGYNFLLVDARAHGKSEGPWDPKGHRVAEDLMGWVNWLREVHGQMWVGLWGHSFGATVGLSLAARPAGGGLDAMVLDSPAISGRGLYAGMIQKPLYWIVQPVIQQLADERLQDNLQTAHVWMPILFIHGMLDSHVPQWHSEQAYEMIWSADEPERVELWLVPGADHLEGLEIAPKMYIRRALDWFDRWLGLGSPSGGGST